MMRMRMRGGVIGIIARGRRREHAKARRYRRVLRKTLVVGGIIASVVVVVALIDALASVVVDALASVVVDALASVVVVVGVSIVLAVDDVITPPLLVYSRAAIESRLASRRWRALPPPPPSVSWGGGFASKSSSSAPSLMRREMATSLNPSSSSSSTLLSIFWRRDVFVGASSEKGTPLGMMKLRELATPLLLLCSKVIAGSRGSWRENSGFSLFFGHAPPPKVEGIQGAGPQSAFGGLDPQYRRPPFAPASPPRRLPSPH